MYIFTHSTIFTPVKKRYQLVNQIITHIIIFKNFVFEPLKIWLMVIYVFSTKRKMCFSQKFILDQYFNEKYIPP